MSATSLHDLIGSQMNDVWNRLLHHQELEDQDYKAGSTYITQHTLENHQHYVAATIVPILRPTFKFLFRELFDNLFDEINLVDIISAYWFDPWTIFNGEECENKSHDPDSYICKNHCSSHIFLPSVFEIYEKWCVFIFIFKILTPSEAFIINNINKHRFRNLNETNHMTNLLYDYVEHYSNFRGPTPNWQLRNYYKYVLNQ